MNTAARSFWFSALCAVSVSAAASVPTVTEHAFVQNSETRVAVVTFTLGADSIVTLDIQTNGVSIGSRNFRGGVTGCAFGKMNPAGDYRLEWRPWTTWLDAPTSLPAGAVTAVVTAWSPDNTPDFMDIDLTASSNVTYYVSEEDLPYAVTDETYKTTHLLMKRLHCANKRWTMGSPESEKGRATTAKKWENQHDVVLSQDYYIGVFETTQGQWKRLTGLTLPAGVTPQSDVCPMSLRAYNSLRGWDNSKAWPKTNHFVTDASDIGKARILAGIEFDLPTEAQWEYACRGGTTTAFNTGTNGDSNGMIADADLSRIARWLGNSVSEDGAVTNFTTVGSYEPNGYGLYDTIGNVSELCLEFRCQAGTTTVFDPQSNDLVDPEGGGCSSTAGGSLVSARGSSYISKNSRWNNENPYGGDTYLHRSAYRGNPYVNASTANRLEVGFRLVAPVGAWAPLNSEVTDSPAQSFGSRVVKFKYDLDADAIVTLKVLVYGEPLDGAASCVGGDVNRFVSAGTGKMISWYPDRSLEGLDLASGRVSLKIEKWSKADPPAYMALDLTSAAKTNVAYYSEGEVPGGATNDLFKTDWLLMRRIPAKDVVWWMGVATNAAGNSVEGSNATARDTELRHQVRLSEDYFMGVFPITERQRWFINGTALTDEGSALKPALLTHHGVRNRGGGLWPADGHAVTSTGLLGLLRTRSGGYQFDLPTEAQWEYACRAMTGSAFCDGNVIGSANNGNAFANVTDYGWVTNNADAVVMPVGLKKPNLFGLYDMHGNVWEWCLDFHDEKYGLSAEQLAAALTEPVVDPVGATGKAWSANIVLKGGSSRAASWKARCGDRSGKGHCANVYYDGGSTVRVVCPVAPVEE